MATPAAARIHSSSTRAHVGYRSTSQPNNHWSWARHRVRAWYMWWWRVDHPGQGDRPPPSTTSAPSRARGLTRTDPRDHAVLDQDRAAGDLRAAVVHGGDDLAGRDDELHGRPPVWPAASRTASRIFW